MDELDNAKNELIKLRINQVENYVNQIENQQQQPDVIKLLQDIKKNQDIERERWERNNPITPEDDPIYDWAEQEVPSGYRVQFSLNVPEGWIFFWSYLGITWVPDTTYKIWIDHTWQPELTDTLQDFGDHAKIFIPPKKCYAKAEIWALNLSGVTQTYSVFYGGWLRRVKPLPIYKLPIVKLEEEQET